MSKILIKNNCQKLENNLNFESNSHLKNKSQFINIKQFRISFDPKSEI